MADPFASGATDETVEIEIDAEDVLLLIFEANERLFGAKSFRGITRLEKLVFLLRHETKFTGILTFFEFQPDNFGPFSKKVYECLDILENYGLLEFSSKTYGSAYADAGETRLREEIRESDEDAQKITERIFTLTEDGRTVAKALVLDYVTPSDKAAVDRIVSRFGRMPLKQLIRYVYNNYPETTVNSIHPVAAEVQGLPHG